MKATTILAACVAVALVVAVAAVCTNMTKNDQVTTEVLMDDGMTCTINGKEVANGDTVTVSLDMGNMKIHVDSQASGKLAVCGLWSSDDGGASILKNTGKAVTSADFAVKFVKHGTFKGAMYISNDAADGDIAPIILKFTVDESKVVVKWGDTVIHNNEVVTFENDSQLNVTTADGASHNITYSGKWSNSSGMSSGVSGNELGTSTIIYITDTMYFDAGNGTMDVGVND